MTNIFSAQRRKYGFRLSVIGFIHRAQMVEMRAVVFTLRHFN